MKSKMLFSIIVPVYNVEKYLDECLLSIQNQHYSNYEIILVDDGSRDKSGEICDAFYEKNKDICKVIHKENQGLISARRVGLKEAEGEYIVFVDSDDMIRIDMLELLANTIKKTSPDMIIYQWQNIDNNGKFLESASCLDIPQGVVNKEKIIESVLIGSSLNSLCLKTCKRSLFDIKVDYSELYYIQNAEDLLQSIPVFEKAKSFVYLPETLYYYRMNPTSITHKIRQNQYKNLDVVRPKLYNMLERLGLDNENNRKLFFDTYLECISATVIQICSSNLENINAIFDEILSYDKVCEAQKYLKNAKLGKKSKIVLILFYSQSYRLLNILVKVKNKVK